MGQLGGSFILVTLRDFHDRNLGLMALCDVCRRRWHVALTQAIVAFETQYGRAPQQHDLNGWAKCPHCEQGRARRSYAVLNPPRHQPVWFPGAFSDEF